MSGFMAIQTIPDRWNEKDGKVASTLKNHPAAGLGTYDGKPFIRRPTRGVVLKEETFATLRVVTGGGSNRWLIDAGSRRPPSKDAKDLPREIEGKSATDIYSNFFLQNVQEERVEKQQILETFGEPYIFFFGERARVMSFSGILVNSWDFNWEAEWWANYQNELRGTKCVEHDARVFLQFDNTLLGGYIMSANAQKNAQERNWINFSFTMFITSNVDLTNPVLGNPSANPGVSYSYVTENIEQYMSKTGERSVGEMAQYRPTLISTDFSKTTGTVASLANSLIDAMNTGLQYVDKAWNLLDGTSSLLDLAPNINGDTVRVPIGFQGALAFDEDADVSTVKAYWGEAITFSTFSENDDEYVGAGNQYASSHNLNFSDMAFLKNFGAGSYADELTKAGLQLGQAAASWSKEWARAGLGVPEFELGAITQGEKLTKQYGLQVAKGVKNWSSYLKARSDGERVEPFASVIAP